MSKLNLEIRRAHIQDAAEVHRIMRAAFEEYCGKLSPPEWSTQGNHRGRECRPPERWCVPRRDRRRAGGEVHGIEFTQTISTPNEWRYSLNSVGPYSTATTSTSHSARELFSGEDGCQSPQLADRGDHLAESAIGNLIFVSLAVVAVVGVDLHALVANRHKDAVELAVCRHRVSRVIRRVRGR